MSKARVFAIQVPARRDGPRGQWVEKYDLSAAKRFGELIRVLPYGNVPSDPWPTRMRIRSVLNDFDYASDRLLLLGDPVAIAHAIAFLAPHVPTGGSLVCLKWDRRSQSYVEYPV